MPVVSTMYALCRCTQPCMEKRPSCGHPCAAPCHVGGGGEPTPCPSAAPCRRLVRATCPCSRRHAERTCADNARDYAKLVWSLFGKRLSKSMSFVLIRPKNYFCLFGSHGYVQQLVESLIGNIYEIYLAFHSSQNSLNKYFLTWTNVIFCNRMMSALAATKMAEGGTVDVSEVQRPSNMLKT